MKTQVTLIPGDGIGPSISHATVRILDAAGAAIEWDTQLAGMAGVARCGEFVGARATSRRSRSAPREIAPPKTTMPTPWGRHCHSSLWAGFR